MRLLAEVRERCVQRGFFMTNLPFLELYAAGERVRMGEFDEAVSVTRQAVDQLFQEDQFVRGVWGATVFAEALLKRGATCDLAEVQGVIGNLANLSDDVGGVVRDIWLLRLRALLANAQGDEVAYQGFVDQYAAMANSLGFEGHIAMAEAM